MSTTSAATAAPQRGGSSMKELVRELERREPRLATASRLFLLATIPVGLAVLFDHRLVNGIDIWIKPLKFLVSLAIYYGTLAWFQGYLPSAARERKLGWFLVQLPIAIGLLEMTWLVVTAALGVPSHFNRSAPIYEISYMLAGIGATTLMVVALTTGILIGRAREPRLRAPIRLSLVLGSVLAFTATMITAGFLASGRGHWVGGAPTDAGGLPLLGWSRTGGDLRVAHFFAMHALQVVPLLGWAVARSGLDRPRTAVWILAGLYAAFIAWTFVQALSGVSFL